MSGIIRVHKRAGEFAVVPRAAVNNTDLTWEARGMLVYLLDKPDGWQISVVDLIKKSPAGRDQTRRILRELTEAGHVYRERKRGEAGLFDWVSDVFEEPLPPEKRQPLKQRNLKSKPPYTENPSMDDPSMDDPSMENQSIYRKGVYQEESSFIHSPLPPDPQLDAFCNMFLANLLQEHQTRVPTLLGPVSLAESTRQHLRRFMIGDGTPILSAKAISWAMDQWEKAKPNERFNPANEGATNWLLATITNSYANAVTSKPKSNGKTAYRQKAKPKDPNRKSWAGTGEELITEGFSDDPTQPGLFQNP